MGLIKQKLFRHFFICGTRLYKTSCRETASNPNRRLDKTKSVSLFIFTMFNYLQINDTKTSWNMIEFNISLLDQLQPLHRLNLRYDFYLLFPMKDVVDHFVEDNFLKKTGN